MKSVFLSLLFTFFALGAQAQSANVQKVSKSVFSLTTFKKDGSSLLRVEVCSWGLMARQ